MTLYGKEHIVSRLNSFKESGRFPHGLLLTGARGVGKRLLADYIAKLYVCEQGGAEPCGVCRPCRKITDGCHPDVVYVRDMDEDGKYRTALMRTVTAGGCVKPNDGDVRVYIFEGLDEMSEQCQNTLLKFIEEPLSFNKFVFTAESVSGILSTIQSRVVTLEVDEMTAEQCKKALLENEISSEKADKLIALYGGNVGKCLDASESDSVSVTAEAIALALAEKNEYKLAAKFSAVTKRDELTKVLCALLAILRDALVLSCGGKCEYSKECSVKLSRAVSPKKLSIIAEKLSKYISKSDFNPNVALAVTAYAAELYVIITN